jgi:3,4-dihydroxy 2-butanone 4-phosphate synthase/GTP cyclohydrolase II
MTAPAPRVRRVASARLPTAHGDFVGHAYTDGDGTEHLALVAGTPPLGDAVLVRVQSECLTGEVFASRRCDCRAQLEASLVAVAAAGRGVVVHLRHHEGRGIGLGGKIAAYALQDDGADTVEANLRLGFGADERRYDAAAGILEDLGVGALRLLTNNPAKVAALVAAGHEVRRVPLLAPVDPEAASYLRAKRDRLGHLLEGLPPA